MTILKSRSASSIVISFYSLSTLLKMISFSNNDIKIALLSYPLLCFISKIVRFFHKSITFSTELERI